MRGRGRWLVLAAGALLLAAVLWIRPWPFGGDAGGGVAGVPRPKRIVPEETRIRVEVLNASGERGLARRGTAFLRDLGFDVVGSGNAPARMDSTTIWVRGGRQDWAELAAKGLGGARIEARPDSSRYLDLTILLGPDWRPPPEPFDP